MSRSRRALPAAVAIVVALFGVATLLAPPASAHVQVVGTSPAADAQLDAAPTRAEVRFDSGLLDIGYAMVVRSADGRTVSTGPAQLGPDSIAVATDPAAGPGRYTVAFRVVSADGHEVASSFDYTVTGTPTASPTPVGVEVPSDSPTPNPSEPQPSAAEATEQVGSSRWTPAVATGVAALGVAGAGLLAWALLAGRRRH